MVHEAADLVTQAGLSFRRRERSLFARVSELSVDIRFLRAEDILLLCAEGAIDLGITGGDLIDEAGVDLTTRLALGFGTCRLSVCVAEDPSFQTAADLAGCRLAISFTNVIERFF